MEHLHNYATVHAQAIGGIDGDRHGVERPKRPVPGESVEHAHEAGLQRHPLLLRQPVTETRASAVQSTDGRIWRVDGGPGDTVGAALLDRHCVAGLS